MAENPGDLSLPLSVISRIVNDALPANVSVSTETRKAIAKAASVFILYATASAAGVAARKNRKTANANDVLEGIVEMDFAHFVGPLKKALDNYQQNMKKKPSKQQGGKKSLDTADEDSSSVSPPPKTNKQVANNSKKGPSSEVITLSDDTD